MSVAGFFVWLFMFALFVTATSLVPYGRRGQTMVLLGLTCLWFWGGCIYVAVTLIRWLACGT